MYRPLGSASIIATHDQSGYNLHMIRPSGECYVLHRFIPFNFNRVITLVLKEKENKCAEMNLKKEILDNLLAEKHYFMLLKCS